MTENIKTTVIIVARMQKVMVCPMWSMISPDTAGPTAAPAPALINKNIPEKKNKHLFSVHGSGKF